MSAKKRRRAFSYLRFSSPAQAKGDSFRRQTALAADYARAHNLELDESLTFHDLGVSAYRGVNSETGQLGTLLHAVQCGLIPKNSVILVESLDRISRQAARKALRVIESIVESGVSVVTLNDGREYTVESLDNDPISLLMALLTFIRANEESVMKSQRLAAVWAAKRVTASTRPMTSRCPGWVTFCVQSRRFIILAEHAAIIRQIFDAALAGDGILSITRSLNANNVPTLFGGSRRAKYWQAPGISLLLKNTAVLGTFTPHISRQVNGKTVRTALEPILNYYPAVVSPDDFMRVQETRISPENLAKGTWVNPPIRNILAYLGQCSHCQSAMIISSRSGKTRYLVCRKVYLKAGCQFRTVRYHEVEDTIKQRLHAVLIESFPRKSLATQASLDRVKSLMASPVLDLTAANTALRTIIKSVFIHPDDGKLSFNWKHGGTTVIESAFVPTTIRHPIEKP
ncbi:recombinase family protein [Acidocella sp.]|uniref:recombinase family protein n=1 Tax=Acidocella sp. TaxID=50710 RepID=UPI0026191499|nr:recombinase family protein [Acidocella sp.]